MKMGIKLYSVKMAILNWIWNNIWCYKHDITGLIQPDAFGKRKDTYHLRRKCRNCGYVYDGSEPQINDNNIFDRWKKEYSEIGYFIESHEKMTFPTLTDRSIRHGRFPYKTQKLIKTIEAISIPILKIIAILTFIFVILTFFGLSPN